MIGEGGQFLRGTAPNLLCRSASSLRPVAPHLHSESEEGSVIPAESDSGERTGLLCMQRVSSGGPQGDIVGEGEVFYA